MAELFFHIMVEIFFIKKICLEKKFNDDCEKKHVYEVVNLHTIFFVNVLWYDCFLFHNLPKFQNFMKRNFIIANI